MLSSVCCGESHLQLQQPALHVFFMCGPSRRVPHVVDGGQGQGHAIQHMKQTLIQHLTEAVCRGGLGADRFFILLFIYQGQYL